MTRPGIETHAFALVIVRLGRRVLLIHEQKHGQRWYFPAGRVHEGETLMEAARRETREEAGIDVVLEGVLRVEHTPVPSGARLRAFFIARPAGDEPLKSTPDIDSLGADWFTFDELHDIPLRGSEVLEVVEHVFTGGQVFPLSVLGHEGAPWRGAPRGEVQTDALASSRAASPTLTVPPGPGTKPG